MYIVTVMLKYIYLKRIGGDYMENYKNYQNREGRKVVDIMAKVALTFGKVAANSTCCYIYHQPKMPESLKRFRKS